MILFEFCFGVTIISICLNKKIAKSDAKAFMDDNKGAFFAILSYADENGETTLEHGNIFRKLPHVTISHH